MGDYELYHASTRKHKYIKKIGKRYFYTQDEIKAYLEGKKPEDVGFEKTSWIDGTGDKQVKVYKLNLGSKDGMVNSIGVAAGNKTVSAFNATNKATEKNAKKYGDKYVTKRNGRIRSEYDSEFGSYHTLDLANKKEYKKRTKEIADRKKEYGDTYIDVGEERKKKISKAKKSAKKQVNKSLSSMKKQSARGKKALQKFYKNNINPDVTVTYDEAVIK